MGFRERIRAALGIAVTRGGRGRDAEELRKLREDWLASDYRTKLAVAESTREAGLDEIADDFERRADVELQRIATKYEIEVERIKERTGRGAI